MATEQSRVDRAIETVCTKLGYAELTPDQEKAVKSFVSGRDVRISRVIPRMSNPKMSNPRMSNPKMSNAKMFNRVLTQLVQF